MLIVRYLRVNRHHRGFYRRLQAQDGGFKKPTYYDVPGVIFQGVDVEWWRLKHTN